MSNEENKRLIVPQKFTRNHPATTSVMSPDEAGKYLLSTVEERTGRLLENSDILDIGCGTRFAASIINCNIRVGSYTGVDIYADMIDFLATNTQNIPNLFFHFWNMKNDLYNPGGAPMGPDSSLPVDKKYDLVLFFSVFTHLNPADARIMLKICRDVMKNTGQIFLTAFINDKQEEDFIDLDPSRPLLKAVFSKRFFEKIVRESNLVVKGFHPPAKLMAHQLVLGRE